MAKRSTTLPRLGPDGRCRVSSSFSPTEAAELTTAAEGQPVASFVRWAALRMARAANAAAEKGAA